MVLGTMNNMEYKTDDVQVKYLKTKEIFPRKAHLIKSVTKNEDTQKPYCAPRNPLKTMDLEPRKPKNRRLKNEQLIAFYSI